MKRRTFLKGTAAGGALTAAAAAGSFPSPAISQGRMEWRMVTAWPKGFPGLGTSADRLAKRIGDITDGKLTVKVYAGGELVPALQVFDAVSQGTAELGHDASYYHLGKSRATAFFTTVPYGLTALEHMAWLNFGGGQELWDELYAPFNLKAFPCGNTGAQTAGWFNKEIKSVEDLNGLKIRTPGMGGEVIKKLGATVVLLPGGEIFQAMQSGAIDAVDWVGPYNDLAFGLYKVAKYYYWPGVQEPSAEIQLTINKQKYDGLSPDLQQAIAAAAHTAHVDMTSEFTYRSAEALQTLVRQHNVQLKQMPRDVLIAWGKGAGELMAEILDGSDPMTKKVATSYLRARQDLLAWTRTAEQAQANARLLPFPYPTGA